uniref:Transmembrane protein 182 n=1 Tax=Astyanax mexicanus TaxID=7994 RepID=A0A8B9L4H3_ASTMX
MFSDNLKSAVSTRSVCQHNNLLWCKTRCFTMPLFYYYNTSNLMAYFVTGGFLLVCAVPFFSHKLYRAGGTFFITAACLFLVLVGLFVLWKELVDVRRYVLQERGDGCPGAHLEAHYGWSFMVAVAGIPLVLLSGLLFFCVGKHIQKHT